MTIDSSPRKMIGFSVNLWKYLPTFQGKHKSTGFFYKNKPETDSIVKETRNQKMMNKSLICLALVLVVAVSVTEGGLLGGYKPIKDLSDPNVVEIAKYAITEHNKQSKTNLVFGKVVQGKEKVVSGKMYDLTIAAKSGGGGSKNYEAVVWDKPFESFRELQSFKAV